MEGNKKHFVCEGNCGGSNPEADVCKSDTCTHGGKDFASCDCEDGRHGKDKPCIETRPEEHKM